MPHDEVNLTKLIGALYAGCNRVREILGDLHRSADNVQAIAMNAAVAASHTGNHIRVFTEIARQIEHTAGRIATSTVAARHEIDEATNLNLNAVIDETKVMKYRLALAAMATGTANHALVTRCVQQLQTNIRKRLTRVFARLCQCEALLRTMVHYQHRLFAILTKVRSEAVPLHGRELSTILSLADNLDEVQATALEHLDQLLGLMALMKQQIRRTLSLSETETETDHETRQAI